MIELKGDWKTVPFPQPKTSKSALVIRYGGFGDVIQASSILPQLKREGYEVFFSTTNNGREIVRHDPNIDTLVAQDRFFVPEHELGGFWERIKPPFTRYINLSGVVEGRLLAAPGSVDYLLPAKALHRKMNKNYLEATHEMAGLPFEPNQKFYPTKGEVDWARKERDRLGRMNKVIVWSLAGSSVHKLYPYTDYVIANLMTTTRDVKVVLVGDQDCKFLEQGWQNEPRVIRKSGKWSIRQSMAFLAESDLVVGSETGLLNCAGHMNVPKICLMSHSSIENLTKHWVNNISLTPDDCPCYPCHKMHSFGFRTCNRDSFTHAALCMSRIGPDAVVAAIHELWRIAA